MPFNMQGMEWVILILVALLIFGGSRLAGAGKNAGRAIREFKEETRSIKADEEAARKTNGATSVTTPVVETDVVDAEIVENPVTKQNQI